MMQCEMCGRFARLVKARVEGSELDVCEACSKYGKIIQAPQAPRFRPKQQTSKPNAEELLVLIDDFSNRIRQARERLGLTQEEFAKKVAERHSLMQKIEGGSVKPSIALARKLENQLHVKLLISTSGAAQEEGVTKNKDAHFTIADFIKNKK